MLTVLALLPGLLAGTVDLDLSATDAYWLGDDSLAPTEDEARGRLVLSTSGSTGAPTPVPITLARRERHVPPQPENRWLCAYEPVRWAAMSVALRCHAEGSSLIVPKERTPSALVHAARDGDATHLGVTPTLLRLMLASDPGKAAEIPLRQVVLGGEVATQSILDAAARTWPDARVTHVYATTEDGDGFASSDGYAGFPIGAVTAAGGELAADGELWVRGRPTGDLWEIRDDRVVFAGRRSDVINVGGRKVRGRDVELAAEAVPGVEAARAYPTPSPLTGELVALDYVGVANETEVSARLRQVLPKEARPARVRRLTDLPTSSAGKVVRREVG